MDSVEELAMESSPTYRRVSSAVRDRSALNSVRVYLFRVSPGRSSERAVRGVFRSAAVELLLPELLPLVDVLLERISRRLLLVVAGIYLNAYVAVAYTQTSAIPQLST
jgi:hypothetical protein